MARRALDSGENFYAYDIAEESVPYDDKEATQRLHIMALALARSGSLGRASELMKNFPETDNTEIVGLKSRILKDMALNTKDVEKRKELFCQSADLSLWIFNEKRQYYNGINAASCLFMAGQRQRCQALVREQVLPLCLAETDASDFWLTATLGECYLLLEDYQKASAYYSQAALQAINEGQLGNLGSTLKQFEMLSAHIPPEQVQSIISGMRLPKVAVFSGHMVDRPERKRPRFPSYAEEQVRLELAEVIVRNNIRLAFVSCACGGDILFIEEMLKNGGECFILPPLPLEETIKNSVDIIPGADWKQRLERVLAHENSVLLETECEEIGVDDDVLVYDFTNRFLLGAAIHWSAQNHFPLCGVTVWNRESSGLAGGTDSTVALWEKNDIPVSIVTPEVRS